MEMKELKCLRCSAAMEFLKEENIQLGKTGWLLGDWPNLLAGAMRVKIFRCCDCGKLEFFSGDEIFEVPGGEEQEAARKVCPVCNAELDEDCPCCPICGFRF